MVFGICIGFLAGALVVNIYLKEAEHINKLLKKTINNLEDDLKRANFKVKQRDNLIHDLQKENKKLKDKQVDFESNIQFLVNNSKSKKIKELFADTKQDK